jgi:transcriptional regulator with XRE-family HTH domain
MSTSEAAAPVLIAIGERSPGRLVRETRVRHQLSQKQLAIRAGTTQSAIARIEADGTSPAIETLRELLRVMGEDLVIGTKPREWGIDGTLNETNRRYNATERLERGLGFSDVVREMRGAKKDPAGT